MGILRWLRCRLCGSCSTSLVWRPYATKVDMRCCHIHDSWNSLYNAVLRTPGPTEILFDPQLIPASDITQAFGFAEFRIPAGTYRMGTASWRVLNNNPHTGSVNLVFDDAVFTEVRTMQIDARAGHIGIVNNNQSQSPFEVGRGVPTDPQLVDTVLLIDNWQGFFGNVRPFGEPGLKAAVPMINVPEAAACVWRMFGGGAEPAARFLGGNVPLIRLGPDALAVCTAVTGGIIAGPNFIEDTDGSGVFAAAGLKAFNHRAPFGNRFDVFQLDNLPNFGGLVINEAIAAGGTQYSVDGRTDHTTMGSAIYNDVHLCNTQLGPVNIGLPSAYRHEGQVIGVKDSAGNAATNNIHIHPDANETIDGAAADATIEVNYGYIELVSDGTNWLIK